MMSSSQAPVDYQSHIAGDYHPPSTSRGSVHSTPLDLDSFMMEQNQHPHLDPVGHDTPPQLTGTPQFANFSFDGYPSLHGNSNTDSTFHAKIESQTDPYSLNAPSAAGSEHRNSITSQPQPRASFSSQVPLGVANPSIDGSEDASPASGRNGRNSIVDGFGDEFGLNSGGGDGSDLGAKTKDEKDDGTPPWSELKTKAGKERKRLPLACIACRRKKIRCSGEKPACKHCLRSRIPCVYKVTTRKAAPRTDYMAMLDKRLKRMEERIIKIVPKEEHDPTAVTRSQVKPTLPGTTPAKANINKKRVADDAFGSELDMWAKTSSKESMPGGSKPPSLLLQEQEENKLLTEGVEALPPREIQEHLAEIFFENLYGQTYHLLHKPSFMRKLKAETVPPVLILTVCAVSARFSSHPKLNENPAFLRGEDWAKVAREIVMRRYEWPNITILTCLLLLGLHEFGTCQGGRSWSLGGMAIRMAYALQLHKDLDHDPQGRGGKSELSFIDREIRRRTMWACFLMDRFNSSGTDRPTFMKEDTMKIQLPVKESFFLLDIPGPTEDLYGNVPNPISPDQGQLANAKENMGVAAYMIRVIALWGRIINYLNLGGREQDEHPMWHSASKYTGLVEESEKFNDSLLEALTYNRENLHAHDTEGLSNQYIFLHVSIQMNILFLNRFPGNILKDAPKDFVTNASKKAFHAATRISEILKEAESYFVAAPFVGYCAFLSSTVHMYGLYSKNPLIEAASKRHLATNVKYLAKMKKYWGMFHWMSESLKDQYRACADNARQGANGSNPVPMIFQYGDWFDRYPHGVSQSDFEDPVVQIKKEKGDDAVLEQKSDYKTVEEFFQNLSPSPSQESGGKRKKMMVKKGVAARPQDLEPTQAGLSPGVMPGQNQNLQNMQGMQSQQNYHHMSPNAPPQSAGIFPHAAFYGQEFMSTHQQGIMPQLDRQLVFGAYAGMEPNSNGMTQHHMMDNASWDMFSMGSGYNADASSAAWFMPFNMEPPELAQDADVFGGIGPNMGMGYAVAGMSANNDMGGGNTSGP